MGTYMASLFCQDSSRLYLVMAFSVSRLPCSVAGVSSISDFVLSLGLSCPFHLGTLLTCYKNKQVCRIQAQVFIKGVGSVTLSWYTKKKPNPWYIWLPPTSTHPLAFAILNTPDSTPTEHNIIENSNFFPLFNFFGHTGTLFRLEQFLFHFLCFLTSLCFVLCTQVSSLLYFCLNFLFFLHHWPRSSRDYPNTHTVISVSRYKQHYPFSNPLSTKA